MTTHPADASDETPRSKARDAEVKAIVAITKALEKLDDAGRARVLAFVVAQQEAP